VPPRLSAVERIRAQIDELFASEQDLGEILEEVARLNVNVNPTGLASAQDPRLVEVMQHWGFTSGTRWLVPDPSHFEYLQPA
jgi:hypothetical protein